MDTTEQALSQLQQGFAVLPVKTGHKVPTMKEWTKHPVTDPDMVRTFLNNPGTRNYGIVEPPDSDRTVIVIDVDDGAGATESWRDRLKTLYADLGKLPKGKVHQTPSGGYHLFFLWPEGIPAPRGATFHGFTLRILRGTNMVVGPGSALVADSKLGQSAGTYTDASTGDLGYLPDAWAVNYGEKRTIAEQVNFGAEARRIFADDLVATPLLVVSEDAERYELPDSVGSGGRYSAIRDFVASKWNQGLSDDEIKALVHGVLTPRFTDPLTESEVNDRIDRVMDKIGDRLGTRSSERNAKEPAGPPDLKLIVPIDEYVASIPTDIPWIIQNVAYLGGVTLLSGGPKAGKSTLAAQMQLSREDGRPFLGHWASVIGPTLLVTEEGGIAVRHKTTKLHKLDVLDRRAAVMAKLDFDAVLGTIALWCEANPAGLVFIDTLAIWGEIDDENDATAATKAIAKIMALTQVAGCAVVLIHHTRKSGGDNGEAIRGSSAILGTVDLSLELGRVEANSNDRRLLGVGRVIFPLRNRLEFDEAEMMYSIVDEADAENTKLRSYADMIPRKGTVTTVAELELIWGISTNAAKARANKLAQKGMMHWEQSTGGRTRWEGWSLDRTQLGSGLSRPVAVEADDD